MNVKLTEAEWILRLKNRQERMSKLIALNAPAVILEGEAKLMLMACLKTTTYWGLVRKLFVWKLQDSWRNLKLDCRIWWLIHVRKMSKDDAIEKACSA